MILLDANAVLELLLPGRHRKPAVINWMQLNKEEVCISMLTVHLTLHFGFKEKLTLQEIKEFLASYPKIALLPEDYVNATQILKNQDHEDALQLSMAERTGCSSIVTLDQKFADTYRDRINFITV